MTNLLRRPLLVLALLALAAPAAFGQTLAPVVDGHVLRAQTVLEDLSTGARTCAKPNGCVDTFVYFDKVYVGGQNSFTFDFDPNDGKKTVYWRDSRPVFEFDISSVPAGGTATLRFTALDNIFPAPDPNTPMAVTLYRLSSSDANGTLTACDFNAAGGGFDNQRWVTLGCANLVQQPTAGSASLTTLVPDPPGSFTPQTYSVDVTSAFAAAKASGQSRLGLALAAEQGTVPATDTNFDGDELLLGHSTSGSGSALEIVSAAPNVFVADASCPGTTVGQPTAISVRIRNTGGGVLSILGVTERAGSDSCSAFTVDTTGLDTSLGAGEETSVSVVFSPTAAGTCAVILEVRTDDADMPLVEKEIACTATSGAAPKVLVSPTRIECGPIPVGATSPTTVTISNTGSATLVVQPPVETSDPSSSYQLSTSGTAASVPPGGSTSFVVTFAPTAPGAFQATYLVRTNDVTNPEIEVVFACAASSCTSGGGQAINVIPGAVTCVAPTLGGSSSSLVTIQNVGGQPLEILGVTEVSDPDGVFRPDLASLATTLACGAQTSFRVVFSPVSAGAHAAIYRIASTDPARPTVDVTFSCSGSLPQVTTSDVTSLASAAGSSGRWVAASAKASGAEGTNWVTDLKVENTEEDDVRFRVVFLAAGRSNLDAPSAEYRLAPGGTLAIGDVLGAGLFGRSGAGAVLVAPVSPTDASLIVASRTYNQTSAGTYGQFIAGASSGGALVSGGRAWILGLAENADFRTNVGAVNLSATAATVRFRFRSGADGEVLGTTALELAPFGQGQLNRAMVTAGVSGVSDVFAEVVLEAGASVLPWASVIDNRTGDPIFVPAAR